MKPKCSSLDCSCQEPKQPGSLWDRRSFLTAIGAGAGMVTLDPLTAMAGPFEREDFNKLVPADKKLSPAWLRSLTERGAREVYRGPDLEKIGMPVGGICAGQVYLGGDGKLWHWDIFNQHIGTGAEHYANPVKPTSPFDQGFAIRVESDRVAQERPLSLGHWPDLSFCGEYPIGYVNYSDPDFPVDVRLEAFSPFIPLNTEDSSLPATVLEFTITNKSKARVDVELAGWLQNAVCLHSSAARDGFHVNRLVRNRNLLSLECSAEDIPSQPLPDRPDILFDDFERDTYAPWEVLGNAFGSGPVEIAKVPEYQGNLGGHGGRVVNSHASGPGSDVGSRDSGMGTLISPAFTIERSYICFRIGGGAHQGKTCINLLVDGRAVLSATGRSENLMHPGCWDVRRWAGKEARLQILDQQAGPWGNIGIDEILFTDHPKTAPVTLADERDFGTMTLGLLQPRRGDFGCASLPRASAPAGIFSPSHKPPASARSRFGEKLTGSLTRKFALSPGETAKAVFVLAWHMPTQRLNRLPPGRYYGKRFQSATGVLAYVAANYDRLQKQTRLWHDTWYDSTLPFWFLNRTFLNTSILASSTCHRLADGRFYAWEGVGCCEGTCGHVWQYAHAMARLFPELERHTRERVDFGLAMQADGAIRFRGEFNDFPAIDSQAGTILRALREHQMAPDETFLKRNWPAIRKATQWLIAKDENGDGLIEGNQHNTLDTDWFGPVAWLSGLYLAALLAAEAMARHVGDVDFAAKCRSIFEIGNRKLVVTLFDGEYFINRPDPKHADTINSGTGCEIDQVFGQSWAFQVGLPRVFPARETLSALHSLWRYNFTPDVGPYREAYKPGRWYAMPGEAGLLMCTFPRTDWDYAQAKGKGPDWAAGYFNECMNGFEYQVAGHMIWEGMVTEGLAITRAVHDRYHPSRRNPWNEVECGDHYARSMASYGVYLAACGYACDGPAGKLRFAPRLNPQAFRAAFTTAQGWGTFQQAITPHPSCVIHLKFGTLNLRSLELNFGGEVNPARASATLDGKPLPFAPGKTDGGVILSFASETRIKAGQKLEIRLEA
jgi:uncharacterized protein (DUF608 family)